MSLTISREILAERRPWKTPISPGPIGGMLDRGKLDRAGHAQPMPTRRPWKKIIQLGGDDLLGRYAYAGITAAGIVTVYEQNGSVRWSKTLLSGAYLTDPMTNWKLFHDLCFDNEAGLWIRSGDQNQLVHVNSNGTVLSDTVIGTGIYSSLGVFPSIAHSQAGVCYANQLHGAGDPMPIVAHGPSGDLTTGVMSSFASGWMGITNSGKVISIGFLEWYIWYTDGSVLFSGGATTHGGFGSVAVASVNQAGDYFHTFGPVPFVGGGIWQRLTFSIATGTLTDIQTGESDGGTAAYNGFLYGATPNGIANPKKVDRGGIFCAAGYLEWPRANGVMVSLPGNAVSCAGFVPAS